MNWLTKIQETADYITYTKLKETPKDINKWRNKAKPIYINKFKLWLKFCDEVLDYMYNIVYYDIIELMLKNLF